MKGNVVSSTFKLMKSKHGLNMSNLNWEAFWHTFWVIGNLNYNCIPKEKGKYCFGKNYQTSILYTWSLQRSYFKLCNKMVGGRHRGEPEGEAEKWKRRLKV